ncbi:MAG: hypothetical protein ACK5L5_09850 [Bacteroidales bacterium]
MIQLAFANGESGGDEGCDCADGPGASECSCSGEILGIGMDCSVTCQTGYYACCSDLNDGATCKCVKESLFIIRVRL